MKPADFIGAKRLGEEHDRTALETFFGAFLADEVADYQVSAWLMAVCLQGLTERETADLTQLMAASGDTLDLSGLPHTVDKHSTGGVGDKTSLVLAPLLAVAGGTVAKMTGRGLGHTGGTVDKLESIPGFRAELPEEQFLRQAAEIGVAVTGQSRDLAPLDGRLYALRDATATVQSLPLIASSVMSKKLAGGARSLVLDVKVGAGAFMRAEAEAAELARMMLRIGSLAGLNVTAVLSGMDAPLGREVGNACEVREAVDCLRGGGPADLRELCLRLGSLVLNSAGLDVSERQLAGHLDDGSAWERFVQWVEAQGGDAAAAASLPLAPGEAVIAAPATGTVTGLDAGLIGRAVGALGGGRSRKDDLIDP
ncbi:MAG TPA: thymidine phosphorylase, partial [Deinococcales bacterium]|nr:thymidine phosphorylase [Deinococcales bacterium]